MKKWKVIVGILAVVVIAVAFAIFGNRLAKEEFCSYYKQELTYNQNDQVLEGKQLVGFYNDSENVLNKICLHLYPNAFREGAKATVVSLANYEKAYPNGKSYGNINIESVNSGEQYLDYVICGVDENILEINLNKDLYPAEIFEFEIGFSVKLANINHRLGYGKNTINLCNYYPILCVYENGEWVKDLYNSNGDPFYSKCSNYEVKITYGNTLTLASSGKQQTTTDAQTKTTTIKAEKVRDFAMVLSDKFEVKQNEHDGIEINYYYYNDGNPNKTTETIKEVLNMNKKYGKYPYNNLSVVEANFVHGGMEYPQIVLISDNLANYDTYTNVVVHELCHQWWYGVVGNNQYKYGFLDEGLTDYNTALFYETYKNYNLSAETIFNNAFNSYTTFVKVYKDVKQDFSTNMIKDLNMFETENEYVYLTYVKGMLMFASLEDLIGTKKMDKCIKQYFNEFKFKEATPQDLVNCFSRASGKNLQSYFDAWFNGDVVIDNFK